MTVTKRSGRTKPYEVNLRIDGRTKYISAYVTRAEAEIREAVEKAKYPAKRLARKKALKTPMVPEINQLLRRAW